MISIYDAESTVDKSYTRNRGIIQFHLVMGRQICYYISVLCLVTSCVQLFTTPRIMLSLAPCHWFSSKNTEASMPSSRWSSVQGLNPGSTLQADYYCMCHPIYICYNKIYLLYKTFLLFVFLIFKVHSIR